MAVIGNVMKWESGLEVGIEVIDNQHKILFDLANDLINAVNTGASMRVIDILFSVITSYTYQHFETEENLLKDDAELARHLQEHYRLLKQLHDYKIDFHNGREGDIDLATFLKGWLNEHIRHGDLITFSENNFKNRDVVPEVDTLDGFDSGNVEKRIYRRLRSDTILVDEIIGHCFNATKSKNGTLSVLDFSSGGMKIFCDSEHDIDDLLIISCNIGPEQKIKEKVRVRNVHDGSYGVEFVSPAVETVAFLGALCGEQGTA